MKVVVLDVETTGLEFHKDQAILLQIASPDSIQIFNLKRLRESVRQKLSPLFAQNRTLVFHNAKFDLFFIKNLGIKVKSHIFCTQVASQIMNAGRNQRLLFNLQRKDKKSLKQGIISDEIRDQFSQNNIYLSDTVNLEKQKTRISNTNSYKYHWLLEDVGLGRTFILKPSRGELNVCESIKHSLAGLVQVHLGGPVLDKEQ